MNKLIELTDVFHGYCVDYLENSEKFVHDNQDLINSIVGIACKTAMVGMLSKASVDIVRAINHK